MNRPHCAVHVAAEMVLAPAHRPIFVSGGRRRMSGFDRLYRNRRIWRCSVPGCARIEAVAQSVVGSAGFQPVSAEEEA